jgi:hypothetical protein
MPLDRSFTVSREAVRAFAGRMLGGAPAPLSGSIAEAPAPISNPENWRLNQGLAQADAVLRQNRIIYEPELEPIDPSTDDEPWPGDLEPEDPSLSSQLRQAEDDAEEEPPPEEETAALQAKDVDITIVDVDEEIEVPEDEEPAYQLPQVPA